MPIRSLLRAPTLLFAASLLLTGCLSSGSSSKPAQPETTEPLPQESVQAYLGAAAIGVSNLEDALDFYINGLGMREIQRLTRDNRIEVVLEAADAKGSRLVLMDFTDNIGRNFQQNPGKLVFYVKDPAAIATAMQTSGGRITLPPMAQPGFDGLVIGFGRDPDNNLIELIGEPTARHSYFGAFGIGVSDLQAARDFYVDSLGLQENQFLSIPGQYDEYILTSEVPGSSALVLMHWTNDSPRNYLDNPVKLEFEVSNPQAFSDAISNAGMTVIEEPTTSKDADLNGATVGYAADADGTLLEIRQSIRAYLGAAGIGVEDLDAAVAFYKDGLGMQEVARRSREDRDEVVLESADGKGSQVVLMSFTDGKARNTRQNPGKLVFYAKDPTAYAQSIRDAGGTILLEPVDQGPALGNAIVGFGRDLDNNLIEIVGDSSAVHSYFGAFGIGVSDLQEARRFYAESLGLRIVMFLAIPGQYDEYILQGQGGSALVLMQWLSTIPRNYTDNPVKLEMRSISPSAFIQAIEKAGERVIQQPEASQDDGMQDQIVGYAKDADGTLIEVQQAAWGK